MDIINKFKTKEEVKLHAHAIYDALPAFLWFIANLPSEFIQG